MKKIFLDIQKHLSDEVASLRYIDKNWGQLNEPQPPVQFPCALLDVENIDYSQLTDRDRVANATLSVVIASQNMVRTSAKAPSKEEAYAVIDTLEAVMEALEGFRIPDTTQALTCTRLQRSYVDKNYSVYILTYTTAWVAQINNEGETVKASPSIKVRILTPDSE
ncbi:MAG: hypothetical protein J6I49_03490 [Bacteroidales bacterium]|nr:hypothetical protein [Bacteroidales bacterium]